MQKYNLLIDIGNSSAKLALSRERELCHIGRAEKKDLIKGIRAFVEKREIGVSVISSVVENDEGVLNYLREISDKVIILDAYSELPIEIDYETKSTLGADRIAAAVAVNAMFPGENSLIFDFGTAITVDFLSDKGVFKGGNISPGMNMRFNALHKFTERLPMCEQPLIIGDIGKSTNEAIEAGVVLGIMFEVEGYLQKYQECKVIFTGGDSLYFAKKLKNPIFVIFNLILTGLSYIADHHANI